MAIEDDLARNYEAIVADPSTGRTFKSIADDAEANGSPDLAAWARKRAAESGKDTTPKAAKSEVRSVRDDK